MKRIEKRGRNREKKERLKVVRDVNFFDFSRKLGELVEARSSTALSACNLTSKYKATTKNQHANSDRQL